MNIEATASLALEGRFTITARNPDGSVRTRREFKNLITDLGLNGIGTNGTAWSTAIALGTGTATPNVADTALSGTVISVTGGTGVSGIVTTSPRYSWGRWTKVFAQGAATGNWTEIGIGRNSTTLWSRALILDGLNAPTTLSIVATDILTVEYELRVYYNETDVTGVKSISGVDTTYTVRLHSQDALIASRMLGGGWMNGPSITGRAGYTVYNGTLGAIGTVPSGSSAQSVTYSVASYVNNSFKRVCVSATAGIGDWNVAGGISVMIAALQGDYFEGGSFPFKFGFSPPIAKDNTKTMLVSFSFSWARRP